MPFAICKILPYTCIETLLRNINHAMFLTSGNVNKGCMLRNLIYGNTVHPFVATLQLFHATMQSSGDCLDSIRGLIMLLTTHSQTIR